MKFFLYLGLTLSGFFSLTGAPNDRVDSLRLSDALEMAGKQNYDIRLMEEELASSSADVNKTYSLFLPQVTLSETYVTTNDPLNVFGMKLKQEIVTLNDFNPALLNDPKTIKNYSTKVDFQQPLINLDGWFGRRAASSALKATQEKDRRTKAYIRYEVMKNYYQLVLVRSALSVIEQSVAAVRAYRDQANNYYNQGLIHRSDLLNAEVQLLDMESKRIEAVNQITAVSDRLRFLMGSTATGLLLPVDTLSMPASSPRFGETDNALKNRSDMRAMRFGIEAMKNMRTMNYLKLVPSINAFGSYEMNENKLFGNKGKNWMAGIMLKWEVFKGWDHFGSIQKSSAELRHSHIQYQKATENNRQEMASAMRNLEVARKKTELTREAVQQAMESLRIMNDRYNKGLERTSDLLMSETMYSTARLNHLQALFTYRVNVFTLELLFENETEIIK